MNGKICFFLLSILFTITVLPQSIRFDHLSTKDGLSNNDVCDILQDKSGFLWFATDDGLNRFDGQDFKIFRNDPLNENSLSDNSIGAIKEDTEGNIWIGTKNGWLNRYNPVNDSFNKWKIKSEITGDNTITAIFEDNEHYIWIGTYRGGLYRLDLITGKRDHWLYKKGDETTISNNYITSILQDNEGCIWISTYQGLNKINPHSTLKKVERYLNIPGESNCISNNIIWSLTKSLTDPDLFYIGTSDGLTTYRTDEKIFNQIKIPNPDNFQFGTSSNSVVEEFSENQKILWIDSYAGLIRLNLLDGSCQRFYSDVNDPYSLTSNQIYRTMKDRSGVLWIATNNGLNAFSFTRLKFNNTFSDRCNAENSSLIEKKSIKAVTKTSNGNIWFGTEDGLYYEHFLDGSYKIQQFEKSKNLHIWSLAAGKKDDLWVGTYGSGLYRLDIQTNQISHLPTAEKLYDIPMVKYIKSVFCDNENNIWIGHWGFGLGYINNTTGEYLHWMNNPDDPGSLSYNDVWVIYQDKKDRIWIGTNGGGLNLIDNTIDFIDKKNSQFYRLMFQENNPNSISSNSIYSIYETEKGKNNTQESNTILWVGTNNGLNKLEINDDQPVQKSSMPEIKVSHFTTKEGLPDNSINCLAEDDAGNLWIGTNTGISLFNTEENKFTNFGEANGISGGSFNSSSAYNANDGYIFMGSTSGLNCFSPKDIKLSDFVPPVQITDFQIFNKSVEVGKNSVLQSNITSTNEITLSYKQDVFSFLFSALDYNSPKSIKYAYMMEGFDNEWVQSGPRRFATYTNLNPGEYFFKVKATNSDGIWNKNAKVIKIFISPPWWQASWAIGLYFIIFLLGIWGITKFQNYRAGLQNELKVREFESRQFREIEKMKSRFFANLSHEFRTPLMLIKGPIEELISGRIKENLQHYYKMLLRNTEKLQNLIDQLLELSQLESETIPLNDQNLDIIGLLKGLTNAFLPLAENKGITLNFISPIEELIVKIDRDKTEKIINNLLSNAFKFTGSGGKINVDLEFEDQIKKNTLLIRVIDNGMGIPEEDQDKIFNRFYQVEKIPGGIYSGSGIGLALVKELVNLQKWSISFKSKRDEGTTFLLRIPLDIVQQDKNISGPDLIIPADKDQKVSERINESVIEENRDNGKGSKHLILFVEDSPDVRGYVYDLLKNDYEVILAENAEKGIVFSIEKLPDLIISDIMMPGMDGIEFCGKVKTNWQTSHIPVILLTAKATSDSKIEGLETGADDYVTKPFSFDELSARIKNLIKQRNILREKFSKEINIDADALAENPVDNEFLKKILNTVEKNIKNAGFNTEMFAEELFVSRRQLHRKLVALTGQGPGEFIRTYKLKQAAQLILENNLSITQIAYEVGFESPAQFTRAFKKHFACLPSEFIQRYNNQNSKYS